MRTKMMNSPPKKSMYQQLLDGVSISERSRNSAAGDTSDVERMVIFILRRQEWSVRPTMIKKDFNLELFRPGKHVAVKIFDDDRRVSLLEIEQYIDCVANSPQQFTGGICVSTSGFTPSVYSFLRNERITNLKLAIMRDSKLIWNCEEIDREDESERATFIGVFTCKGGVGKTTISAHLAGALALNGYDVSLVDLDHQRNLSKLLGDGVYLPPVDGHRGARIDVGDANTWKQGKKRTKYVVCDCNPEFDANPTEFVKRFDYCIIPTNLSPLGINKNADVIVRTFDLIRKENKTAHLFVLLNGVQAEESKRNAILNKALKTQFASIAGRDERCHYIDPSKVAIRFSKQLLYWGYHLFDGSPPTLGFKRYGKYSFPRMDFLKLVDYLETHTPIKADKSSVESTRQKLRP